MAHLKAWLRSPQSRQRLGAIRLAVLGVMLLAVIGTASLMLPRHRPAAASTGKAISSLTPKKDCGCRKSDDIAGTRLHDARTATGTFRLAQSSGGEASGADVIIPDAARWNTWVLTPGDRRVLATMPALPKGGHWTAMFGTITESESGHGTVTYAAPAYVPPYGLDEIEYGNSPMGPNIQLMVSVHGNDQSQKAAMPPAGAAKTSALPSRQDPTVSASLSLLQRVPANIRGSYAQTIRWLKREQSTAKPSRIINGGYVLPAWVDDASVLVYTPVQADKSPKRPPSSSAGKPTR